MTPEEIIDSVQTEINPQRKLEKMLPLVLLAVQELRATKTAILKLVELQEMKAAVEAKGINKTVGEYKTSNLFVESAKVQQVLGSQDAPARPFQENSRRRGRQ